MGQYAVDRDTVLANDRENDELLTGPISAVLQPQLVSRERPQQLSDSVFEHSAVLPPDEIRYYTPPELGSQSMFERTRHEKAI